MVKDGALNLDFTDDLIAGTCLTHAGEIKHAATKTRVGEG
jgi:NAD(P) transhydrogenase subunit alpha